MLDWTNCLHFIVGEILGNTLQALGVSVEHNVIISSVVFVAKEVTDPVFSNSDLLFGFVGLFNALI